MKRKSLIVLIAILCLGPGRSSIADVAPPWYAQGATINISESMTNVQMVSEQVLLVVENREAASEELYLAAGSLTGHVEATFVMRNLGTTAESFDVWFPIGPSDGMQIGGSVENFAAWVDGVSATLGQEQSKDGLDMLNPWATWPVTFPPGQDVTLRVSYDVLPVGYHPYATFHYILETGAGWQGPIGEGTVTFRLPYEANDSNTIMTPEPWNVTDKKCCNPDAFTISSTDVAWHFVDLEPAREDNICLTMMVPSKWDEIIAARQAVSANPDSPDAHLGLARTLVSTLLFMPSIWPGGGLERKGNSDAMAESAALSYERVLELGNKDVEIYAEYLELVGSMWQSADNPSPSAPENLVSTLSQALELAPNDERLLGIQDGIAELESFFASPTIAPEPTPTPVATPLPAPTATAMPVPTLAPTSVPTLASTMTPAPAQAPDGGGLCPGAMTVPLTAALMPLIALVLRKQGRKSSPRI